MRRLALRSICLLVAALVAVQEPSHASLGSAQAPIRQSPVCWSQPALSIPLLMFLGSQVTARAAEVRHSIGQIPPAAQSFLEVNPHADLIGWIIVIGPVGIGLVALYICHLYDRFVAGGYSYRKPLGISEYQWKALLKKTRADIKRIVADIQRIAQACSLKGTFLDLEDIKILADFYPRLGIEPFIHLAETYKGVTPKILQGLFLIKDRLETAQDVEGYGRAWNRIIQAAPEYYSSVSDAVPFLSWFPNSRSMEKGLIEVAALDPKSRFKPYLGLLENIVKSMADYRAYARAFAETVRDNDATRYMASTLGWSAGRWCSVEDWRRGLQAAVQICEARARTPATNRRDLINSDLPPDDIKKLGPVTVLELERDIGFHDPFMLKTVLPAIEPLIRRFGTAPFRQLNAMAPEAFSGLCYAFTRPGVHVDGPRQLLDMNFWRSSVYDVRKKLAGPHTEMVEVHDHYSSWSARATLDPAKEERVALNAALRVIRRIVFPSVSPPALPLKRSLPPAVEALNRVMLENKVPGFVLAGNTTRNILMNIPFGQYPDYYYTGILDLLPEDLALRNNPYLWKSVLAGAVAPLREKVESLFASGKIKIPRNLVYIGPVEMVLDEEGRYERERGSPVFSAQSGHMISLNPMFTIAGFGLRPNGEWIGDPAGLVDIENRRLGAATPIHRLDPYQALCFILQQQKLGWKFGAEVEAALRDFGRQALADPAAFREAYEKAPLASYLFSQLIENREGRTPVVQIFERLGLAEPLSELPDDHGRRLKELLAKEQEKSTPKPHRLGGTEPTGKPGGRPGAQRFSG
jgi:hypothetical protein